MTFKVRGGEGLNIPYSIADERIVNGVECIRMTGTRSIAYRDGYSKKTGKFLTSDGIEADFGEQLSDKQLKFFWHETVCRARENPQLQYRYIQQDLEE